MCLALLTPQGMQPEYFEQYCDLKQRGLKQEARKLLLAFISSFQDLAEKTAWTKAYLHIWEKENAHKIRYELYEAVIFPALLHGYRQQELWGVKGLIQTAQNFYQAPQLWSQIDQKTDWTLLEEAQALAPDDESLRQQLISKNIRWFDFCQHEWPAGILYGQDGASIAECEEILKAVEKTKVLDCELIHQTFLDEFVDKVHMYQRQLLTKS